MVKPLLEQLRTKVENAQGLSVTTKSELLKLVSELKKQTTGNAAINSAAGQQHADKLTDYVEELEISHPEITDLANCIATMLANMGI